MKLLKLKIAILAIVSCAAGPLFAGELLPVKNCAWCHGTSLQGFAVAPRLAGQRQQYIVNQLQRFHAHVRDNFYSRNYMWAAAANVGPELARELAAYISSLPPEAAQDGPKELVAEGRTIYEMGVPDLNVVACVACHGPRAEGVRQIPRLGGLSYYYLQRRLQQWQQGFDAAAAPMPRIARNLSPRQLDALASYLSYVSYGSFER
ncbi:c-type cytochrome [Methylovirgula sp. HY1]|uniref:c-type cytochrome n=1 Tax=Methylovirgula sp. HY1 TaxID=2822761 RepID=UPI001C5B1E98|nr:c-type cytochrome [Methylovirgula sp. HY1]QXX74894.1 Cytochrome c-552 [Methylovirgula sp. HY1]